MRILQAYHPQEIKQIMQDIRVDPYGIKIMLPKTLTYLLRMNSVSSIAANILKQEMLSLGADVAIARGALTGKVKKTDCLLMGSLAQFNRLKEKLNRQPFGLNKVSRDLKTALENFQKEKFTLDLGKFKLNLGTRPYIMGIVNLTADSFSGDGLYRLSGSRPQVSDIVDFAKKLVEDGADIIDMGAESSRPGAEPITAKEELGRIIPVLKKLNKRIKVPLSVDTYKPEVARQALDNGAAIINDITGLRNNKMAKVIGRYNAGVVIVHMKGNPRTMQKNPRYVSLMDEIVEYLEKATIRAQEAGINKAKIIIDPGIGFGKTAQHNLEILKQLKDFKVLGKPILVGPSRKSFIGEILNATPQERINGTVSACLAAVKNGAHIVRVHDVKEVKEALKVFNAIESA